MRIFLALLFSSSFSYLYAQNEVNLNWIVLEDEHIQLLSGELIFALSFNDGRDTVVQGEYYPGNLIITPASYKLITSNSVKIIRLRFGSDLNFKNKLKHYEYDLELKRCWIDARFFILKLYNLDKRKNRKKYKPIDEKSYYTFEVTSPCGSFLRFKE